MPVAIGPLVGGALTDPLGWESIFLINVPIGAAAVVVTRLRLRESRDPNASRVDWLALLTFSGALFLLVLALFRGNDEGWGSAPIVSLLAGAGVLFAAFVAVELRVRAPMLPLELFRWPAFTGVQLAAFAVSASMFALPLSDALPAELPRPLAARGGRPVPADHRHSLPCRPDRRGLLPRVPARLLMSAGLALAAVGMLAMSGLDADSDWTALLPGFLLAGAGVGLLNPVIADVAMSVVPKERSGMAAGINDTFRQVGVAVGIAAWGAILLGRGAGHASELGAEGSRELIEAGSSGNLDAALAGVPPAEREALAAAAREGFLAGLNDVLVLGAGLALAGAVLTLWLIGEREIEREPDAGLRRRPAQPAARRAVRWRSG